MYTKKLSIHCLFLAMGLASVVCLKKDKFYCEMSSPCTCVSADNVKIDLAGVSVSWNVSTNVALTYQPCPNDEHNPKTVAIEIVNATSNVSLPLAYYVDVQFEIGDAVMLVYKNNTDEFDVILSCDSLATSGKEYLTNFQNGTPNFCTIVLKTSQVCGLNLKDAYENSSSDSWTFFFSFLLVVAFVYFVCGSIVNACLFNKIGIDMVPHHTFWSLIYSSTKEKLCGTSMMASAYESI